MNDTEKLKTILFNVIKKSDGNINYRIFINNHECSYYMNGAGIMFLTFVDNDEEFIVNNFSEVQWDDAFLATFNYNNVVYGIDIVKDLTPEQIFNELL